MAHRTKASVAFADVNGQRIRFDDGGGDGPRVILSHGFLMDRAMFAPQVRFWLDWTVQSESIGLTATALSQRAKRDVRRVERIIRAAAELVAERGVAGTSLDDP
jgi:pimeloyl-ACP methyl ester carboxylesterase